MKKQISKMTNGEYFKYLRGCLFRLTHTKVADLERIAATEELIDDVKRAIRRDMRRNATAPKRSIRQNSRGVWRGYEGSKLVEPNFYDDFAAEHWLNEASGNKSNLAEKPEACGKPTPMGMYSWDERPKIEAQTKPASPVLPLHVQYDTDDGEYRILDNDGFIIGYCGKNTHAALIVKAINEYDALNAVAEAAENSMKGHTETKLAAGRVELRRCLANLAAVRKEGK